MSEYFNIPRLYIDQPFSAGAPLAIDTAQTHYLKNVLRLEAGAEFRVFNGRDGEYLAEITGLGKKHGAAQLKNQLKPQPAIKPPVHLLFSPIKKHRLDILIEKVVELGVTDLHPVLMRRTVLRTLNEDRLRAQILEAAEQCERFEIPRLHPMEALSVKLGKWKAPEILWCNERGQDTPLSAVRQKEWAFLIGPEGGFDDEEINYLGKQPLVRAVSLGEQVLRAETAAIYCLAAVNIMNN